MSKLKTYVSVDGRQYGPGDGDIPSEIAERITNPDVWDTGDAPAPAAVQLVGDAEPSDDKPGAPADEQPAAAVESSKAETSQSRRARS